MFYYMSVDFCSVNVDINKLLHLFFVGLTSDTWTVLGGNFPKKLRFDFILGKVCVNLVDDQNSQADFVSSQLRVRNGTGESAPAESPQRGLLSHNSWDPSIKNQGCWDFWKIARISWIFRLGIIALSIRALLRGASRAFVFGTLRCRVLLGSWGSPCVLCSVSFIPLLIPIFWNDHISCWGVAFSCMFHGFLLLRLNP